MKPRQTSAERRSQDASGRISPNLGVDLGGIKLANPPVVMASGTFGYGMDYIDLVDPASVGAVVVKGTTLRPRAGNPPPRIVETPCGMLNAIGLENPGIRVFLDEHLPSLLDRHVTVIANIAGGKPSTNTPNWLQSLTVTAG